MFTLYLKTKVNEEYFCVEKFLLSLKQSCSTYYPATLSCSCISHVFYWQVHNFCSFFHGINCKHCWEQKQLLLLSLFPTVCPHTHLRYKLKHQKIHTMKQNHSAIKTAGLTLLK